MRKKKHKRKWKRTRAVLKCPIHNVDLVGQKTVYGMRYECPEFRCTVACWDGSTSTPADDETRQARIEAHNDFDILYIGKWGMRLRLSREELYKKLAEHMKLPIEQCHIGYFNIAQCKQVVEFSRVIKQGWFDKNEKSSI